MLPHDGLTHGRVPQCYTSVLSCEGSVPAYCTVHCVLPCAATALFGYFSGQVYDDLNWGFVWMGGSPRSVLLLDCLLESWEHVSFVGHSNFHRRSQPRINHLLEEHFENSARNGQRLHVCKVPVPLHKETFRHMSGQTNARSKIVCAVAEGVLSAHPPNITSSAGAPSESAAISTNPHIDLEPTRTLGYVAPSTATVDQQQAALDAALIVANASSRAVRLPATYNKRGQLKPFCTILNARGLPHDAMLISPEPDRRQTCSNQPPQPLPRATAPSAATQGPMTLCVSFEALLALPRPMATNDKRLRVGSQPRWNERQRPLCLTRRCKYRHPLDSRAAKHEK